MNNNDLCTNCRQRQIKYRSYALCRACYDRVPSNQRVRVIRVTQYKEEELRRSIKASRKKTEQRAKMKPIKADPVLEDPVQQAQQHSLQLLLHSAQAHWMQWNAYMQQQQGDQTQIHQDIVTVTLNPVQFVEYKTSEIEENQSTEPMLLNEVHADQTQEGIEHIQAQQSTEAMIVDEQCTKKDDISHLPIFGDHIGVVTEDIHYYLFAMAVENNNENMVKAFILLNSHLRLQFLRKLLTYQVLPSKLLALQRRINFKKLYESPGPWKRRIGHFKEQTYYGIIMIFHSSAEEEGKSYRRVTVPDAKIVSFENFSFSCRSMEVRGNPSLIEFINCNNGTTPFEFSLVLTKQSRYRDVQEEDDDDRLTAIKLDLVDLKFAKELFAFKSFELITYLDITRLKGKEAVESDWPYSVLPLCLRGLRITAPPKVEQIKLFKKLQNLKFLQLVAKDQKIFSVSLLELQKMKNLSHLSLIDVRPKELTKEFVQHFKHFSIACTGSFYNSLKIGHHFWGSLNGSLNSLHIAPVEKFNLIFRKNIFHGLQSKSQIFDTDEEIIPLQDFLREFMRVRHLPATLTVHEVLATGQITPIRLQEDEMYYYTFFYIYRNAKDNFTTLLQYIEKTKHHKEPSPTMIMQIQDEEVKESLAADQAKERARDEQARKEHEEALRIQRAREEMVRNRERLPAEPSQSENTIEIQFKSPECQLRRRFLKASPCSEIVAYINCFVEQPWKAFGYSREEIVFSDNALVSQAMQKHRTVYIEPM